MSDTINAETAKSMSNLEAMAQPDKTPTPRTDAFEENVKAGLYPKVFKAAISHAKSIEIENERLRAQLADQEPLIGKAAEAMGFIRFAAICFKLNGPQWSEEPGFAQAITSALMEMHAENERLKAEAAGMRSALTRMMPTWWQTDGDEPSKHNGQVCGEITFGDVREAAAALSPTAGAELLARLAKAEEMRDKLGRALEEIAGSGGHWSTTTGEGHARCISIADAALADWRESAPQEAGKE